MKRKSIFTFCAIALMLVLSLSVLTACNKNGEHNFSEEWSNDETYHWHACADKGCKEIKDKAEHSWDGGNVTVEPTTEKEGAMVYGRHKGIIVSGGCDCVLRVIFSEATLFL
jgi:lipoprotein